MSRTLLAVGIAVLVSMMLVPRSRFEYGVYYAPSEWLPFFLGSPHVGQLIHWGHFALQTLFAAILLAVLVNIFPRRPRK